MAHSCCPWPTRNQSLLQALSDMRILVLGGSGQIGWELQRSLAPLGEILAPLRAELDLLDLAALRAAIRRVGPSVIVNAAAYTDVDRAESEPDLARELNTLVPAVLALEARELGALLIHYSTDYVFDGSKARPYLEEDAPHPLNVYGVTKLEGDEAIKGLHGLFVILRTSWVYGLRRPCFVTRVLALARRNSRLRFATDQIGSPTWCRTVAQATTDLLARTSEQGFEWLRGQTGLYHLACRGWVDRYGWAREILNLDPDKREQTVKEVDRASSADFASSAQRPTFSALDSSRFAQVFGIRLPEWGKALRLAMRTRSGPGEVPSRPS